MCVLNKKTPFFSIVFSIKKMSKLVWSTYNTQFRYFLCLRCCQKRVKVEGIKEIMFLSISNATCKTQGYFIYIPWLFLLQSATPKSWNLLLLQDETKVGPQIYSLLSTLGTLWPYAESLLSLSKHPVDRGIQCKFTVVKP